MEKAHKKSQKCHVCGGSNELQSHEFFNQIACSSHKFDGTPKCWICRRFKEKDSKRYVDFGDGRKLCSECFATSITDDKKLKDVSSKVLDFYQKRLNLPVSLKLDFPILMVDQDEIYRATNIKMSEVDGTIYGATLRNMVTPITSIKKVNFSILTVDQDEIQRTATIKMSDTKKVDFPILMVDHDDIHRAANVKMLDSHGSVYGVTLKYVVECIINIKKKLSWCLRRANIKVKMKVVHLTNGPVTSILLQFGFPEVVAGAVLADMMMAAWIAQQGWKLEVAVDECIRYLVAYLWLKELKNEEKNNLKDYVIFYMKQDYKSTYGDGLNEAIEAVEHLGLLKTIEKIKRDKSSS